MPRSPTPDLCAIRRPGVNSQNRKATLPLSTELSDLGLRSVCRPLLLPALQFQEKPDDTCQHFWSQRTRFVTDEHSYRGLGMKSLSDFSALPSHGQGGRISNRGHVRDRQQSQEEPKVELWLQLMEHLFLCEEKQLSLQNSQKPKRISSAAFNQPPGRSSDKGKAFTTLRT